MRDDDLRQLEREAGAGGPAERVRYARALERVGRRDDAHDALLPARDDPEVRRELARFPAWSQPDGDGGGTRAADVDLLPQPPRLAWSIANPRPLPAGIDPAAVALAGTVSGLTQRILGNRAISAASSLGVVVSQLGPSAVLDPVTGAERFSTPHAFARLSGDVLLALDDSKRLVALDLASGGTVASTPVEAAALETSGALAVAVTRMGLIAHSLEEARRPLPEVWRFAWQQARGLFGQPGVVVTPSLVLVWGRTMPLVGLDPRNGQVRFRIDSPGDIRPQPRADSSGFAVALPNRIVAYDEGGEPLWEQPGDYRIAALSRDTVVVRVGDARGAPGTSRLRMLVLERGSGRLVRALDACTVTTVRDGLYALDRAGALTAVRSSGERLWSATWAELAGTAGLQSIACVGRWLFASGTGGACLGLASSSST